MDGEPCVYSELLVRTQSPAFAVEVAPGSFLDEIGFVDPGDYFPSVSDGWWVILPAPPPGEHELHFHARNGGFEPDVTYHLLVD